MRSLFFTAALIVMTAPLTSQTTWYVDASASPGGNGSAAAPFQAIHSGVNAAVSGDTVLVLPGTYVGGVTVNGKDITLRSTQGPNVTIMGFISGCGLTLRSTSSACVVEGLTITGCTGTIAGCINPPPPGGNALGLPGGLLIRDASPIVRRCIVKNNIGANGNMCGTPTTSSSPGRPGGVLILGTSAPVIENCVITGNTGGNGFYFSNGTQAWSHPGGPGGIQGLVTTTVRQCTITGNTGGHGGVGFSAGRGGVEGYPSLSLVDCIVWGNTPGLNSTYVGSQTEIGFPFYLPLGNPTATWCDIRFGYPGTGNFDANPLFVNPGTNYRLSTGSPCVDRGTLAGVFGDIDDVWRPQYLEVDVGAYEWRPPAALTLAIAQPGGPSWAAISTSGGGAGDFYINLITADPENGGPYAGNGQWGGLWIPPEEMLFQVGLGAPPFVGTLDANGSSATGIWLPPGLTGVVIYAISHTVGGTLVNRRSPVVAYTFL